MQIFCNYPQVTFLNQIGGMGPNLSRIHSLLGISYHHCHDGMAKGIIALKHLLIWQDLDELHAAAMHLVAY